MFSPLEYRENILIFRGLMILIIVITLGVTVSQQQLGTLTHRQEDLGVFNIACDENGNYSISILGANYNIKAVYLVGQIINGERAISIKIINETITIPTYIEIDCRRELILLDLGAKLLVVEAEKFKQILTLYLATLQEKIHVYITQFR